MTSNAAGPGKTQATAAPVVEPLSVGGVKLQVYKHLLDINAGFDQVIRGLAALRKHGFFYRRELDYFSALSKEVRAATNSYLTGVLEQVETDEAGRRFGRRRAREQREESGSGACSKGGSLQTLSMIRPLARCQQKEVP